MDPPDSRPQVCVVQTPARFVLLLVVVSRRQMRSRLLPQLIE